MKKSYQEPCVVMTQLIIEETILKVSPFGYGDEFSGGGD